MKNKTDIIRVLCFWVIYGPLIALWGKEYSFLLLITGLILTAIYLFIRIFPLKGKKLEILAEEVLEDKPEPDWNPAAVENFENVFKPDFGATDLD